MISVTKEFKWAMSHFLEGHCGLCKNIHGHQYKLFITVVREYENELKDVDLIEHNTSSKGMVTDFKELKFIVKENIIQYLDHAFVYNYKDEKSCLIAKFLEQEIRQKTFAFSFRTTAENMVKYFVEILNAFFIKNKTGLKCIKAVLYETDTSYATYEVEDASC